MAEEKKPRRASAVEKKAVAEKKPVEKKAVAVEKRPLAKRTGIVGGKELAKRQAKILAKPRLCFRGRFGKKSIWKKSKAKWQKWRRPRGIDIHRTQEDGVFVKIGYRLPRKIRGYHPSGLREILARNVSELNGIDPKIFAVRIAAGLGKKKRRQLFLEAKGLGFAVLNR